MPLINSSSDAARSENISIEMHAHPNMNPKQAEAIGYAVQRRNEGHVEHSHSQKHDMKGE